jgi:hypothetical protein
LREKKAGGPGGFAGCGEEVRKRWAGWKKGEGKGKGVFFF